jgi:hypothetical protein
MQIQNVSPLYSISSIRAATKERKSVVSEIELVNVGSVRKGICSAFVSVYVSPKLACSNGLWHLSVFG